MWNEPNLPFFWKDADQEAYFRLYEATARAVKEVDASLRSAGRRPHPGAESWWSPFAEYVTSHDVPIDFVSTHAYSSREQQVVPFGTYQELKAPQDLLDQFDGPRRHLADTALAGLPVHITEFNTSYRPDNPIHDTAYNAAYLAPVLAGRRRPGRLVLLLDVLRRVRGDERPHVLLPRRLRSAHPPADRQADLPPVRVHGPDGLRRARPR